ncbi:acetate--CoA ligase family protein [Pacificispira spongiicola]|uniref:acetate--CoA ligase family protein n=1 Tax=Pacificispira spongiicola TaxID=2729598 RepID=UPI001D0C2A97|nr:acetate--CoA ligase family protein [Pacificispira spongiicola]
MAGGNIAGEGLDRLLRPRSIAVIGGREAEKCVVECKQVGFAGNIYPISKSRDQMAGVPCLKDVADLPEAPDAVFIAIPNEAAIDAVQRLSDMGAGGAVIYASGFAETGPDGAERQERLLKAAGDMGVLGPNCYGIVNYLDGVALWPDDHGGHRVDRGVAIVSQSGNVAFNLSMQTRGLPLAQLAALGNQAKDGVPEVMHSLLRDDRITAIGLFIETVGDIPGFCEAAAAAAKKGVPVVVLKNGRSEAAARVALSHTSSMTGSSAAFDALCRKLAVIQAETLPQFLEFLKFLHVNPGLPGDRIASMSCSGGEAGLIADMAHDLGIPMPPFSAEREKALFDVLGDKVAIDNPLDYHTYIWGNVDALTACFSEVLRHDIDVAVLVLDTPDREGMTLFGWPEAAQGIVNAVKATGRTTIIASSMQETMPAKVQAKCLEAGIAPMQGFDDALKAIKAAAWYAKARKTVPENPVPLGAGSLPVGDSRVLDEWRSKKLLATFGLGVPDGSLVSSGTEAVAAAEALGFPVVVKACSDTLSHKTEAGGVALNLVDADQVASSVDRMSGLSDRFIVEKMAGGAVCELIVGVTRDPQVGPLLMVGAGGILAELMKDSAVLLLPASRADVDRALDCLAVGKLLRGFRGKKADREAVIDAVMAVAAFTEAHIDRLEELDVNPLIVTGDGAVAADALVRWTE